jgi:hypothetical protein
MTTQQEALRKALEIGLDCAEEVAQTTHQSLAGYKPHRHAAVDADVETIKSAIALLAAAPQPAQAQEVQRNAAIAATLPEVICPQCELKVISSCGARCPIPSARHRQIVATSAARHQWGLHAPYSRQTDQITI